MNTPVHKTKYANYTNEEFISLVEHFEASNHYGPLMIELLERFKRLYDNSLDDGK